MPDNRRTTNFGVMVEYEDIQHVRTTNFGVMVEYEDIQHVRTTNFGVMVEYTPVPVVRTTNFGVMVEYTPVQHARTTDIGLMVEYAPVEHIRTTDIGLMVESTPWWHIRTTDIGLMIEYCDFNKIINALDVWPNGDVYFAGRFSEIGGVEAKNVAMWDGVSWYPLGLGLYGPSCYEREGLTIHVHPNGSVYAGGRFHKAGQQDAYHIARWDGTWNPIGAYGGLNGDVYSIEIKPDGSEIYVGGDFTDEYSNPGSGLTRMAKYIVATDTFEPMDTGFDDTVRKIKMSPFGDIYVGGDFHHSGTHDVNYVSQWDGGAWVALGDNSLDGPVYSIDFDGKGIMAVGGWFRNANGLVTRSIAYWNGSNWTHTDLFLPYQYSRYVPSPFPGCDPNQTVIDFAKIHALLYGDNNDLFVAGEGLSYMEGGYMGPLSSNYSGITYVNNGGTAEAKPIIYINGAGTLKYIENQTTRKRLYFDMPVRADEEIFIDFEAGTITSTVRGDLSNYLLTGSDFNYLTLIPGQNKIAMLVIDAVGLVSRVYFTPSHWSADGTRHGETF